MTDLPHTLATIPLGAQADLRVTLDTFNGQPRLDLRRWSLVDTGERVPTRKGVSLALDTAPAVVEAMQEALRLVAEAELTRGNPR